jgi:hypothetical protein
VAEHRRGAEHLEAVDGDATVVFGHHAQRRRRTLFAFGGGRCPPTLWIGHGVGDEHVVGAHVAVVVADVVAEALPDAVEHRRIHHQPADVAREVVGRPTEQAVRPRGDAPMGLEPALQILARTWQQEVG